MVQEKHVDERYSPAAWEKIVTYVAGGLILLTSLYLIVRNEPFKDPNLVVVARVLLSLMAAILGGAIPGFLSVVIPVPSIRGGAVRAGGALALFVVTYFFTPHVFPALRLPTLLSAAQYPPETIITRFPTAEELAAPPERKAREVILSYINNSDTDLYLFVYDFCKRHRAPKSLGTPTYWYAWPFPADGQWRTFNSFSLSNGWLGFAVGWPKPNSDALDYQYLETTNVFFSDDPALIVVDDPKHRDRFSMSLSEKGQIHD